MILSMTGFAAVSQEFPGGILAVELRAVNHRYFDAQMRLPEELRVAEQQLRELIAAKVSRGKIECRVTLNQAENTATSSAINEPALQQLLALANNIRNQDQTVQPFSVAELLRWPGILRTQEVAPETLQQLTAQALSKALTDFVASKAREGEKLKQILLNRCTEIERIIQDLQPKLPKILDTYMAKLTVRLQEAVSHVNEERFQQEFALFAQKIDIDEELGRLNTHLIEVRRILERGGQAGKRLDFLMQELNREANTLGSKSVSAETTQASVELKVLIEQMREQIQNIE